MTYGQGLGICFLVFCANQIASFLQKERIALLLFLCFMFSMLFPSLFSLFSKRQQEQIALVALLKRANRSHCSLQKEQFALLKRAKEGFAQKTEERIPNTENLANFCEACKL